MKIITIVALGCLATSALLAPGALADTTFTTVTRSVNGAPATVVETRETSVDNAPVLVQMRPAMQQPQQIILAPAPKEVVVEEQRRAHHLIDLGVIKVF